MQSRLTSSSSLLSPSVSPCLFVQLSCYSPGMKAILISLIQTVNFLLFRKLPLTPSDWWWHTKCGMLAIPMSALKRYKWVIASIALSAFILGGLWHVQEAFRHLFSIDIIEYAVIDSNNWRSKTFVYIIGALLAIPLIWNGEKIVGKIK